MKTLKFVSAVLIATALGFTMSACGPSAEDERVTQVEAMCGKADALVERISINEIVPPPSADWGSIESFYRDIDMKLQDLSKEASSLGESQLARDFSSVGKNAGQLAAVASLITLVGYGPVVADEWLDSVNELTGNDALRSSSDRSFIGC